MREYGGRPHTHALDDDAAVGVCVWTTMPQHVKADETLTVVSVSDGSDD